MVVSQAKLLKVILKNDGNHTKAAKEIGISQAAVSKRLIKNPNIVKTLLSIREQALKQAGLKLSKAYQRVDEALDAKSQSFGIETRYADHDVRLKAAKLTHDIYHPNEKNNDSIGISNVFNFFVPSKTPIKDIIDLNPNE